ncbi:MAG: hypothetical protein M8364_03105 [Methylobacter sp.]|uniref:hypothetical protein n=1 Tax=Methylobacter sp. TaxID=2051955 RepID=UPI002583E037|nr:hypothetical protein [Methylobacter sp.]MCL7419876.1 hypothetical protein [Methylobacter sp.]
MRSFAYLIILFLSLATAVAGPQEEIRTMPDSRVREAVELMTGFAESTGLSSKRPQQRYLWTDAFAVCNFLGLSRATGKQRYTELALRLVDRVHHTLGRHRGDDPRTGWISGLSEQEGEQHPTRGGLRIGKSLPERKPGQVFDERLEWDRDGQYFHYLTKWMHALDRLSRSTGQPRFNAWARELAETAHHAFTYLPLAGGPRRMHWKMSIDLKRPLVASMGQHDPLNSYITYVQLHAAAAEFPRENAGPWLSDEIRQAKAMIAMDDLTTADPLGIGGLLMDAYRLEQLLRQGSMADLHLLEVMLEAPLAGLRSYAASSELQLPAEYRLAFRELGLAIGLQAVRLMAEAANRDPIKFHMNDDLNRRLYELVRLRLRELTQYVPVGERIESFWRAPEQRRTQTWSEHRDINEVMLATALVPEGFLVLPPPDFSSPDRGGR